MNRTRNSAIKFKFSEGERVLCFEPDPTKARVLYDAKVLEIRVKKDGKGKKAVEYLIHFQGWNSSWDRYVAESFILKDVEEHRLLQKELADTARTILKENRKKRQRIGAALRGADPKFRTDSESSSVEDGDSATRSSFGEESPECDDNEEAMETQDSSIEESVVIVFNIPDSIKQFLEEDCVKIKSRKKLVKLPCQTTVTGILESFVRHYASTLISKNPEKTRASHRTNSTTSNNSGNSGEPATIATQLNLCKEVVDGLRVAFDFLLDTLLLYAEERTQFEYVKTKNLCRSAENYSSATSNTLDHPLMQDAIQWRVLPDSSGDRPFLPCTAYGFVHLCRLLVKLPEVIQKMHLTEDKRRIVTNISEILLQYLDKHKNTFDSDYVASAKYL